MDAVFDACHPVHCGYSAGTVRIKEPATKPVKKLESWKEKKIRRPSGIRT
jgi:hypothetical protein